MQSQMQQMQMQQPYRSYSGGQSGPMGGGYLFGQ
jgi:hypothetical protein